jgi:hypothetical protein
MNKLFAYVKDEGKNLHTLAMTLSKVISCVTLCKSLFWAHKCQKFVSMGHKHGKVDNLCSLS